jgi:hypothetical protein
MMGGQRGRERDVTEQSIYINITCIQADRDEDKYEYEICRDREREARGFMPLSRVYCIKITEYFCAMPCGLDFPLSSPR